MMAIRVRLVCDVEAQAQDLKVSDFEEAHEPLESSSF
jgi:hypothetical protein